MTPDDFAPTDDRLRYLPPSTTENWGWLIAEIFKAGRNPQVEAQLRELFDHRLRLVRAMHRAGVPMMAGTDTSNPYSFPGFALHDELALLVRAGLTPMQALRTATLEPARFLGLDHLMGTVRRGNVADLVLLGANPLDDIRNTGRIHAVLVRGRLITAERRAAMLAEVEAAAAEMTGVSRTTAGCPCAGGRPVGSAG